MVKTLWNLSVSVVVKAEGREGRGGEGCVTKNRHCAQNQHSLLAAYIWCPTCINRIDSVGLFGRDGGVFAGLRSPRLAIAAPAAAEVRHRPPARIIALKPTDLTPQSFVLYGQIVDAKPDGVLFGSDDAQLELSRGIPRFYLMRLKNTSWQFEAITHHANTSQCLSSLHGLPWYWFVARSTIIGATERVDPEKRSQVLKAPG